MFTVVTTLYTTLPGLANLAAWAPFLHSLPLTATTLPSISELGVFLDFTCR